MSEGYWNESIEKFFLFFDITYKSVKKIAPELVYGSPNFSYPSGLKYYYDFFQFAREHDIVVDFLSIHMYGCGDGLDNSTKKSRHYLTFAGNHSIPTETPERNHIPKAMKSLRKMLADNSYPDLPILMDDWNITFYPTDYTRDTCFMAPYVVDTYFKCLPNVYAMGYSSLSDVHEDFFNMDQLFSGGPGLMTYNGIPKAAYLALQMAYNFSRNIIQQGDNYVVGKTDTGYEILIYNMDFYDENYAGNTPSVISFTQRYNVFESIPDLGVHIELPVNSSECNIIKTLINRQHGSAYDTWVSMGSPAKITSGMAKYLKQVSVPAMSYHSVKTTGTLILDDIIEPHSVLHIDIREI